MNPTTKMRATRPELSKDEIALELEAIRGRLATRRRSLIGGGTAIAYNQTDLADAEWLLVELDRALGHHDRLTPSEAYELDTLAKKRTLPLAKQTVLDRIVSKQASKAELTPEELVERDYLLSEADSQLTPVELETLKFLTSLHEQQVLAVPKQQAPVATVKPVSQVK